jgi:hypothetical protein
MDSDLDVFVSALLAGFGVLGGSMAATSGFLAAETLASVRSAAELSAAVDRLGWGFIYGSLPGLTVGVAGAG